MNTFTSNPSAALAVAHQTIAERVAQAEGRAQARAVRAERRAEQRAQRAAARQTRPKAALPWRAFRSARPVS